MNNPFSYKESYEGPICIITIKGDFRSGTYFDREKKLLTATAKKNVESNLVIFDLTGALYWDTETMNYLNDLLKEINQKHVRAAIYCPKNTYMSDRFYEKFGDARGNEVWFESKDKFLDSIKK